MIDFPANSVAYMLCKGAVAHLYLVGNVRL